MNKLNVAGDFLTAIILISITFSIFNAMTIPSYRLERILSNRGIGSRSQVNKLIQQGSIKINNKVITSPSKKFPTNVIIDINGHGVSKQIPLLYAFHKPLNMHSTVTDPWNRTNLEDVIMKYSVLKPFHPVGRLDADTSGLLLFSSNGDLTHKLLNPSSNITREYQALVDGEVIFDNLKLTLIEGIQTTIGKFPLDLIDSQYDSTTNRSLVKVQCSEGKYRMVRRVLHNSGHSVISLHRVRYGNISLNELAVGEIREVTDKETEWIESLL